MSSATLWQLVSDTALWKTGAVAFALGMGGGLAHALVVPPSADAPVESRRQRAARILTSMLVGGVAALASIFLLDHDDPFAFVSGALIAGFAGQTVLASLEARLMLSIARREQATLTRERDDAVAAADLVLGGPAPPAARVASVTPTADQVERARELLSRVRRSAPPAPTTTSGVPS